MRLIVQLCIIVSGLIGAAVPACAANVAGIWALRAQGSTLMLFEVSRGREGWTGSWTQPSRYDTNGEYFNDITQKRPFRTPYPLPSFGRLFS
jgi:hypothetical protein